MSPQEMRDLADRMEKHVTDRGGRFKDDEDNVVIPNGAWSMMLEAAEALRSMADEALDWKINQDR